MLLLFVINRVVTDHGVVGGVVGADDTISDVGCYVVVVVVGGVVVCRVVGVGEYVAVYSLILVVAFGVDVVVVVVVVLNKIKRIFGYTMLCR